TSSAINRAMAASGWDGIWDNRWKATSGRCPHGQVSRSPSTHPASGTHGGDPAIPVDERKRHGDRHGKRELHTGGAAARCRSLGERLRLVAKLQLHHPVGLAVGD